jgi:hypothetical protein
MRQLQLSWQRLQCSNVSGVLLLFIDHTAHFSVAEIDRLNKVKSVETPLEEIPHPDRISKHQDDMGLANDKKVYSYCR